MGNYQSQKQKCYQEWKLTIIALKETPPKCDENEICEIIVPMINPKFFLD